MKHILLMLIFISVLFSSEKIYTYDTIYERGDVSYDKKTKKPIDGVLIESEIHLPYRNGKVNGCSYSLYYDGMYHKSEMYHNNNVIGPIVEYYDNGNISKIGITQNRVLEREIRYYEDGSIKYEMKVLSTDGKNAKMQFIGYYPMNKKHFKAILAISENEFNLIEGYIFSKNGKKNKANLSEMKNLLR